MAEIDVEGLYRRGLERTIITKEYRRRYIYNQIVSLIPALIDSKPAIILSGVRGIGKTTIMLQLFSEVEKAFYFSADSLLVKTNTMYEIAEKAYRQGYTTIFIDEIHKYPAWVSELKNIYDDFRLVQVIASGSSTAALKKGSIQLGRRALDISINPMTFGESVYIKEGIELSATIEQATDPKEAITWLAQNNHVEKYYKKYLQTGGFPTKINEGQFIFNLIKKMIYEDALSEFNLSENKVDVADKLLGFLSCSKLGEFSYNSFSPLSGYPKTTIYDVAHMLKELQILKIVEEEHAKGKANGSVKILFNHPNFRSAFASELMKEPELGALREEYFVFHMSNLGFPVFLPKKSKKTPDYDVYLGEQKTLFEIGGNSKSRKQFEGKDGKLMRDEYLMVLGFVKPQMKF